MKKDKFTVRADGRLQTSIVDQKTGKRKYFYGKSKRTAASKTDEQIIKERNNTWLFPFFALYTGM